MRILMAASEAAPFARTGGLGDVMGALPQALAKLGHKLTIAIPWYQSIPTHLTSRAKLLSSFSVPIADKSFPAEIHALSLPRTAVTAWLVKGEFHFGRKELYRDPATGLDYVDNDERYLFFARALLQMANEMESPPEIIHAHDWQAALLPVLLKHQKELYPRLSFTRTIITIHNLGYQGLFPPERFHPLGLPPELLYAVTGPLEFYGKVNFLKGGIVSANKITTVSETYAREIQTTAYGSGLDGVLQARQDDLVGILNGVDYNIWSPTKDKHISYRFNPANLGGKRNCRVELLNEIGLPQRDGTPLIGLITRLADQKGLDLIAEGAEELLGMNLQMVVLGTGEKKYHDLFARLAKQYPDKLKAFFSFDDSLAHRIEAGADIFLMPSQYEPCGLNQLYSLKYGTVPVVRKTGGLADTVIDWDPKTEIGTGFVFEEYSPDEMLEAVKRALALFARKRTWMKLAKQGMVSDFSWRASAKKYSSLYVSLVH